MAIPWYDGMDVYATTADLLMNYLNDPGAISTTSGRFGGGCWEAAAVGAGLSKSITSVTELWVRGSIMINASSTNDRNVMSFFSSSVNDGGTEGMLSYNQVSGVWKVWRGYQVTQLGSAAYALASGWHWIDVHFKYDASGGIFEVWVDDNQIINLTGQNTEQNSGLSIIGYSLGDCFGVTTQPLSWDDPVYSDPTTGRIGDVRIETPTPNSDATPNNGTPSTGTNHYACVDALPWSSSEYITMPNTSGDKELYGHTALVSTPATVYAVKVTLISDKSDAGVFQLEPLIVSNSVESDGSAQSPSTSNSVQFSIFPTDPNTSAAWLYAAVNASDYGYKVP